MMSLVVLWALGLFLVFLSLFGEKMRIKAVIGALGLVVAGASAVILVVQIEDVKDREKEWTTSQSQKIAPLADSGEGTFVTKTTDKSSLHYILRYVEDSGDGKSSLEEISADEAVIQEDAEVADARIDFQECTRAGMDPGSFLSECGSRTIIHVPKGSVAVERQGSK